MTGAALAVGREIARTVDYRSNRNIWRLLVLAGLAVLAASSDDLAAIVAGAMQDAFLQVTVFVAASLAIVYALEAAFAFDIGELLKRTRHWQGLFAAILGALPGCGGAIIVVTQYTRGYVSFGSVVAVLIATMGDAAFLLLAREPATAGLIFGLSLVTGWATGYAVDRIHGSDFLRCAEGAGICPAFLPGTVEDARGLTPAERAWAGLVAGGLLVGVFVALQADFDAVTGLSGATMAVGLAGAVLCLAMWGLTRTPHGKAQTCPWLRSRTSTAQRVIRDTNFVTSWVVIGFLAYELGVHVAGGGIDHWLSVWAPLVPFVAILIGFVPGCGPQIVVTSLYVTGAVPLSAQIGNSISNDGDALFPALALAPRAAVLATLYSAAPAFVLAYGCYILFE